MHQILCYEGEITVPVIDGSQTQVRIPAGTQTAKQFRIKGKGMPVLRSREVGDLQLARRQISRVAAMGMRGAPEVRPSTRSRT
ncbi:DnaJ C-terminal domain-containing protein [Streptomyces pseudogriseolus]|uniref:DnaJ C-terminal domain-containing protein n=1 Tax=Streptomyces pseudogriseolus TaxID=36817 RepID=UPI003FA2405C